MSDYKNATYSSSRYVSSSSSSPMSPSSVSCIHGFICSHSWAQPAHPGFCGSDLNIAWSILVIRRWSRSLLLFASWVSFAWHGFTLYLLGTALLLWDWSISSLQSPCRALLLFRRYGASGGGGGFAYCFECWLHIVRARRSAQTGWHSATGHVFCCKNLWPTHDTTQNVADTGRDVTVRCHFEETLRDVTLRCHFEETL